MTLLARRRSWVNLGGSAAIVAFVAVVSVAEAGQDQHRQGPIKGGVIQKGKSAATEQAPPADARAGWDLAQGKKARTAAPSSGAVAGITGGAVAGIVVARPEDQSACASGTATACRAVEAGLVTGGAWAFTDGGISAMDDWESPVARGAAVSSVGAVAGAGGGAAAASYARSSGTHIPSAALVHRVLAACDGGDVTACSAFARSVRPATELERAETRTYTAGR